MEHVRPGLGLSRLHLCWSGGQHLEQSAICKPVSFCKRCVHCSAQSPKPGTTWLGFRTHHDWVEAHPG